MAQRARTNGQRTVFPRIRTFGPAALTARQRLGWLWSRESLLRLILSFVLSVALWLYVSNKLNPNLAQDYPHPLTISTTNVPTGVAMVNNNLSVLYVRIKRTDPNAPVTPDSFHPFVDLTGLGPGSHRVKVQVITDPGIDIIEKRPSTVTVILEKSESRRVPVHYDALSHPPTGYGWSVTPQERQVLVSGAARLVSQVARATFDVDLSGLRSTTVEPFGLRPENSQGSLVSGIHLSPSVIQATVNIRPQSSYKSVPLLISFSGHPKSGYSVVQAVINPPQVTISGSPQRLNRITTVKLKTISLGKRGPGTFVTHARLSLPAGVTSHTRTVSVRTHLAAVESSTSIEVGLVVVGVQQGLPLQTHPGRVLATVVGPSTALQGVGAKLRAVVDVAGDGPGTYPLTPRISQTAGVHVVNIYPQTVTVTLTPAA